MYWLETKAPGAEQCVHCAVTCVEKDNVCLLDDLPVSPAGDPGNRRPNIDCLAEGSWGAGVEGDKGGFFHIPFSIF